MTIHVESLELRMLSQADAEPLFELVNSHREELSEWLHWVPGHKEISQTRRFIERGSDQWDNRDGFHLGIWKSGELTGVTGLHYVDWNDRFTSVGCWLAPPYQRQGIMTQAVHGIMHYAFQGYMLNRIEARAATGNVPSKRLFEHLGFKHEGTLREAQILSTGFVDHDVYSVLHSDWADLHDRFSVSVIDDKS